jgi:hypothetical protein
VEPKAGKHKKNKNTGKLKENTRKTQKCKMVDKKNNKTLVGWWWWLVVAGAGACAGAGGGGW